jgi:fumarate hydratase class II
VAIGVAASQGQFELNVYKPLIAYDVLDSLRLLADAMASLRAHCIEGIEVDAEHVRSMIVHSLFGVTALVPHIGYDRATRIARHAHVHGLDLKQAALEVGSVSAVEYDAWVDIRRMSVPGRE